VIPQSNEEQVWPSSDSRMDLAWVGECLLAPGWAAAADATVSGRGCVAGRGAGPLQRRHPHPRAIARTTRCSGPDPGGGDAPSGQLVRLHDEASTPPSTRAVLGWAIERIRNPEASEALAKLVRTAEWPELAHAGIIALSSLSSLPSQATGEAVPPLASGLARIQFSLRQHDAAHDRTLVARIKDVDFSIASLEGGGIAEVARRIGFQVEASRKGLRAIH